MASIAVLGYGVVGNVFFSGKGAGMLPTASSVFGDISDIIQNKNKKNIKFNDKEAYIEKSDWLVRIKTNDRLNTICNLSENFKNCHIYTSNITQTDEVTAIVHNELEFTLDSTFEKLSKLPYFTRAKKFMIL